MPALAQSLLDWDEAQFVSAVRDYDVALHHPHPPGYPLFIACARLFYWSGLDEFRALQAVVMLGAVLLVPAACMLARAMRFDFTTSLLGAVVFAFLPNVWIYSGSGFSDIPALTCGLAAAAFLLRGREQRSAFVLGGLLLGVAIGLRPLSLALAAVPLCMGAWGRLSAGDLRAVLAAGALATAVGAGSYVGAALASSSIDAYVVALRSQSEWVRAVDSYQNAGRPPLPAAAQAFFVRPFDQRNQMNALLALGALSIAAAAVSRRRAPVVALVTFVPIALASWLMLDVHTVARYALAYMFVYALLMADGIGVLTRRTVLQPILSIVVVLGFAVWTWPALRLQATSDAPPVAALKWADRHAAPGDVIYVHGAFSPHGHAVLPGRRIVVYEDGDGTLPSDAKWRIDSRVWPRSQTFTWPRDELWRVVRQRGFEASVVGAAEPAP